MKDTTPTKVELLQHIQELQDMLAEAQRGVEPVAFWVIERFEDNKSTGYWNGGNSRSFQPDIDKAIQFCRHSDAFWATRGWHWTDVEIIKHAWIAPQRTAPWQDSVQFVPKSGAKAAAFVVKPAPAAATPTPSYADHIIPCNVCGYSWYDAGWGSGCPHCLIAELRAALDFKNRQSLQMADALEAEKKAREKWRDAAYGMAREKGEAVTDWLNEKKRAEQAEARVRELEGKP